MRPATGQTLRRGMTLVELMITIMIIAILASLVLFALTAAQESAKEARTRSTIAKLHSMIMPLYESYQTRRVPVQVPPNARPAEAARLRVDAIRELMRMELPDRWSDITDGPAVLPSRPAASQAYLQRYNQASPDGLFQGAECLYLIVAHLVEDGLTQFPQSAIQDTDGDGIPEFIDGWGRPIRFLRWAPGFRSPLQTGNAAAQPDPFDPRRVHGNNFALYPLIYSAGPDGDYDIVSDTDPPLRYSQLTPRNNPYHNPSGGQAIGTPADVGNPPDGREGWHDNIHNHLLDTRLSR
jgi:prepilin-type N-terminal cleavage/methylation domain-containing protein